MTDRLLDGTVFYITFANEMREILGLSQAQTNAVLIQSNKLMQLLDEQDKRSCRRSTTSAVLRSLWPGTRAGRSTRR